MKHPVVILALLLAPLAVLHAVEKPNFIVINIDDLGYADIGPFGSKLNRTPNLDRMAAEGRKLTSFYAAPVCSPSRAALMTGCYPKRVLPIQGVLFPSAAVGLNPEEHTVAELLKQAGYATACIGKWHLGDQPEFLPHRRGFDYYLGTPYSNDMGTAEDGSKSSLGDPLPKQKTAKGKAGDQSIKEIGLGGAAQPPLPLVENETVIARVRQDEQQVSVQRYTEAAVKFIKENRDKPFFLYLPHNAVHFPLYPGKKFQKQSTNGTYGDWVEEVDWSVGQVLDAVRELKLEGKTIVIFTSDNGGTTRGLNTPLRGNKGSTWEGGIRVPTIAWCPGKIPAGTETDAITGMFDILPTFVKLAGGKVPTDRKIDGGDIWPLIAGEPGAKSPHEVFYYFKGFDLEAVRSGVWKLHLAKNELYNLANDPGESNNVVAANPDEVSRLKAFAASMDDDLGTKGSGPGVRPLGRVTDPQPLIGADGTIRAGFEPK
ncbi:MAG: arylsulfatase [Verrucomicrobiaceae bacterium]|nr:MAG: arylsulfatase [Verrucomicrobiaceae bacterium]